MCVIKVLLKVRLQVHGGKIRGRCRELIFNHGLGRAIFCLASVQGRKFSGKGLKDGLKLIPMQHKSEQGNMIYCYHEKPRPFLRAIAELSEYIPSCYNGRRFIL